MSYLGLDLGTKTLGIALTDKTNTIANPYGVIRYKSNDELIEQLRKIIQSKNIEKIILGLPKNMNNSFGFASERSIEFKEILESKFDIPIFLVDERLSTVEAENILLSADVSRKKRKKVIDGVAASIILETYLKMKGD